MAKTKDIAEKIRRKLADQPELARAVEAEMTHAAIAMKVFEARKAAKLTQAQLAERAGTKQSVISRFEDADYQGHSVELLNRIARALGKTLTLEFRSITAPPAPKRVRAAKRATTA